MNLIKNAVNWIPWRIFIDIEGFYRGNDIKNILKKFNSPLIVIDPVDRNRNAAAAVSLEKLLEFKTACKFFLKNPSLSFFFPKPISPITLKEFKEIRSHRNTHIVCILLHIKNISPDIIWGIGLKIAKKMRNILEKNDFKILDVGVWTDEKKILTILFESENICLSNVKKHIGPPVGSSNEMDFIKKYFNMGNIVAGPYIEGRRWIVYKPRKYTKINDLIMDKLGQIGSIEKILERSEITVFFDEDIFNIKTPSFLIYLKKWIIKKYKWIKI